MPANKNALIRYRTIDRCLSNPYRRWTLEDLVEACSDALYELEGIRKGVSVRTIQSDIQLMRSDKLGYNAPIEVFDQKYYRYPPESGYSITAMPMTAGDYEAMQEAVDLLRQLDGFEQFRELADIVSRLQDKLAVSRGEQRPLIHFDSVPRLKGLELLNPLYNHIARRQALRITYRSFSSDRAQRYTLFPYLLKEFRNRWFLFGAKATNLLMHNLALDRILVVEPVDVPFREHPDFDPATFFDDVIGVSKNLGDLPLEITFEVRPALVGYVETKPLHSSQICLGESEDDGRRYQIRVVENFELYSVLLSYAPDLRVCSPAHVAEEMQSRLQQATRWYDE